MKALRLLFVTLTLLATASACRAAPADDPPTDLAMHTIQGQLLLPNGVGSRGVEIIVGFAGSDAQPPEWLLFDDAGKFSHADKRRPVELEVSAGGTELLRLTEEQLQKGRSSQTIDVGVIDLRDQLLQHSLVVRASEGTPSGDMRIAIWSAPPPKGPMGGSVSLGSRQFPTVQFGDALEWLIPKDAAEIYFLVERPATEERGLDWRSGSQQLFGPYSPAAAPAELVMN